MLFLGVFKSNSGARKDSNNHAWTRDIWLEDIPTSNLAGIFLRTSSGFDCLQIYWRQLVSYEKEIYAWHIFTKNSLASIARVYFIVPWRIGRFKKYQLFQINLEDEILNLFMGKMNSDFFQDFWGSRNWWKIIS